MYVKKVSHNCHNCHNRHNCLPPPQHPRGSARTRYSPCCYSPSTAACTTTSSRRSWTRRVRCCHAGTTERSYPTSSAHLETRSTWVSGGWEGGGEGEGLAACPYPSTQRHLPYGCRGRGGGRKFHRSTSGSRGGGQFHRSTSGSRGEGEGGQFHKSTSGARGGGGVVSRSSVGHQSVNR